MLKSNMRWPQPALARKRANVILPASRFNQYNVTVLQPPAHSLRADFARVLVQRFGPAQITIVGSVPVELEDELLRLGVQATVFLSAKELRPAAQTPAADVVVWVYGSAANDDDAHIAMFACAANEVLLMPGAGADVARQRPPLVEKFGRYEFSPDYEADVTELGIGAIRLVRGATVRSDPIIPAAETAFARLHQQMRRLERNLRTRMWELSAADRHIAKLEEKVFALKETKRELKQLKQEKQALRKSPERRIGQVLLAPYRLPQKLLREVRKRWPGRDGSEQRNDSPSEYQQWFEAHRVTPAGAVAMREESKTFPTRPLISIIMPVFNTRARWLEEAIASVEKQAYENWELILIDDGSTDEGTLRVIASIETRDSRLRLVRLQKNSGISAASNAGLEAARGDWIGLLDHDDLLEPDALWQTARLLQEHPEADLIYSDEDKLTEAGFAAPFFKPGWSPDFFLSYNYIQHFTTIRHSLVQELGGFRPEYDFAQDYDLFLRVVSRSTQIHHVPRVLYHWRRAAGSTSINIRAKPETLEAARRALSDHLARRGERGHVAIDWRTHAFQIRRDLTEEKKIAIIIPTRDRIDLLARCIASLEEKTSYENYEIVVIDNDSESPEAGEYFRHFPHRLLRFSGRFNYSAINNFAVEQTDAPWLLFLNSDTEVIESEWLTLMAEHVQRPEVGAVGARLISRDEIIQHAGVVLGVGEIARHAFAGFPAEDPGVCRQLQVTRNYSAVSAACLLTRREVFAEAGGFDEERLPVVFNDTDLCLKMRQAGYLIVSTPFAKLYHEKSASDEASVAEPDEAAVMRERWPQWLERDPYYNPNFSRECADFSLGNQFTHGKSA